MLQIIIEHEPYLSERLCESVLYQRVYKYIQIFSELLLLSALFKFVQVSCICRQLYIDCVYFVGLEIFWSKRGLTLEKKCAPNVICTTRQNVTRFWEVVCLLFFVSGKVGDVIAIHKNTCYYIISFLLVELIVLKG